MMRPELMRNEELIRTEMMRQLTDCLKKRVPQVKDSCLIAVRNSSSRQAGIQAVKMLLPDWKGAVEIDGYGAPYLTGSEDKPVSISVTTEGDLHFCLAVVHDGTIKGIGLDFCSSREFRTAYTDGTYHAGRMFTQTEQARLAGAEDTLGQMILAEIFSGKEAAFKALNEEMRRKVLWASEPELEEVRRRAPLDLEPEFYAEFLELEVCESFHGQRCARPFGRTRDTMIFLGLKEIELVTVQAEEWAFSAGIAFSENL